MSASNSGWNRPRDAKERLVARRRPARVVSRRGVIAGMLVAVLVGTTVWFLIGRNPESNAEAEPRTRKSFRPETKDKRKKVQKRPQISSKSPSLPIPKISRERIEARQDIPAPQPLAEMEATLTNINIITKKTAFRNGAEQLITLATPAMPGLSVPPLPHISEESVVGGMEKAMNGAVVAEEGDSVSLLEKKLVVAQAKEEFRELRDKEGWGFAEYLNALRDKANADAEFLTESHKLADEIYHDKTISDETYIKYRDQINEKLRERGLPEIDVD